MGTALPSASHLPRMVQTANRIHVPALSCTISRMLTKVLKIGRSGSKGTCKDKKCCVSCALRGQAGLEDATGQWKRTSSLPQPRALDHFHTGDSTSERHILGLWALLVTAWQQALAAPAMPRSSGSPVECRHQDAGGCTHFEV